METIQGTKFNKLKIEIINNYNYLNYNYVFI